MKLTRKQELSLIGIGLQHVLDNLVTPKKSRRIPWNKGRKIRKAKWSAAQHKKFSETMRKKWAAEKGNK